MDGSGATCAESPAPLVKISSQDCWKGLAGNVPIGGVVLRNADLQERAMMVKAVLVVLPVRGGSQDGVVPQGRSIVPPRSMTALHRWNFNTGILSCMGTYQHLLY